jgi:hypothetical protein
MRYIKYTFVALLLCLAAYKGVSLFTGDFSLRAITNPYPIKTSLASNPPEEIKQILQKRYHYLSRGHQTYAFVSDDGQYVLKFFNFSQLELPLWLKYLPEVGPIAKVQAKRSESLNHRIIRLFRGHQIAEKNALTHYGIIYQHLQETDGYFAETIDVVDRIGLHHAVPLDRVVFVLQEKAIIAREMFTKLLAKDDMEGVKKRIDQLFDLYLSEYKQGIEDKDPNVIDNVGFVGDQAIRIDVGRLRNNSQIQIQQDLVLKVYIRLHLWVHKYFPGHEREIKQYLDEKINEHV